MKRIIIVAVILVAVVCGAAFGYTQLKGQAGDNPSDQVQTALVGTALSDHGAISLVDRNADPVELSELSAEKPTIVNFWATWCPNCVDEMDDYEKLYEQYGDKVNFIMVDYADGKRETMNGALEFLKDNGYSFPVYFDLNSTAVSAFNVEHFPTTLIVDAQGTVVNEHIGTIERAKVASKLDSLI